MMRGMTTADLYGRKSTDDRGKSVSDQLAEGRDRITENGWGLGRVFADDNRSASRFARKKREDYAELVTHIGSGKCELLVVWEASRGSRRLWEWAQFLELCRDHGTLIHVVKDDRTYDVRKGRDWKTLADDGVNAQAESELLSERSLRGKRVGAQRGRPAGKLQFGFRRVYDDKGRFVAQVEHPAQAAVVREAARRVLAGESCYAVANDLNDRGVPGPRGGRWDLTQVKRLCTMPAYAGLRVHRGQVVGRACWEPIHDEGTYAALLARLNDPRRRTQRDSALKHVLSGVLRCGVCGSVTRVLVNRGRYPTYVCKAGGCVAAAARGVEPFVEGVVLARLGRDDALALLTPAQDREDAAAALGEARELRERLDAFYAAAARGEVSPAGLASVEAGILPRIADAERRAAAVAPPVPGPVRELARDPRTVWAGLTVAQRREAIQVLVSELVLDRVSEVRRRFEPGRLGRSRWAGDARTWAEIWRAVDQGD